MSEYDIKINVTDFDPIIMGQNVGIDIKEVMRDICTQIDDKILLGLFLILTFYTISRFVLPVACEYFQSVLDKEIIDNLFKFMYSMSETLSLGSIIMIIAFAWVQGLIIGKWLIWVIVIAIFLILTAIYKYVDNRNKKKNQV